MSESKTVSRLFMCIGIVFVSCLLLSNLIAGKMWAVTENITLPAAVILFPLTYIIGDVFTEVYGFKKARTIIWLGFGCSFFAVLIYLVTIALPHPGYWENQDRMIIKGNGTMYTRQIIGNAIASGEAEDMIVVFPYIYSSATQKDCTAMDDANNKAYDNFINDLIKDLMPHIEKTYSVKTGRENTAITGFSMGGRESLLIGMKRADLFGYIGAICPAPGVTGSFKWASEEEAPSLVFITAGSNDTVVYDNPKNYHNNFEKNGVPHIYHYVNGGYHGDNSIHAHIYNFVRAVFKA